MEPFARVDSVNCKLWFTLASVLRKALVKYNALTSDCQGRRTLAESPTRKLKRQLSSSRARLTYMFPAS